MTRFGKSLFWSVMTGVAVSMATQVFAAETAEEVSNGSGGLPQFNVVYFPGQIFWLAISFASLYLLMAYVALPRVASAQTRRHDTLAAELDAAEKASAEAKTIIAQYEKALTDARSKAQATVDGIAAEANKRLSESQMAQNRQLQQRLRDSEARIATERDTALKDIKAAATDVANALLEKLAGSGIKVTP